MVCGVGFADGRFLPWAAVFPVVFALVLEPDLEPGLAVLFLADDLAVVWVDFVVDEDLAFDDAVF